MRWRRRDRQEVAIRALYSPRERRMDGRRGKRDGRKRIPTYTGVVDLVEAGLPVVTSYHEHLLTSGRYEMNEAFRAFVESLRPHRTRLIPLNNGLASDLRQVAQCREELMHATAELTEDDLRPRNPREASLSASGALLDRRRSMRRQRIEAARSRLMSARSAAQNRRQAILDVHAVIAEEFALAQARGWRHHDRCLLRIGRYWEALLQAHPEGPSLVSILPKLVVDKPDWLEATRWQDTAGTVLAMAPAGGEDDDQHPDPDMDPDPDGDAEAAVAADLDAGSDSNGDAAADTGTGADTSANTSTSTQTHTATKTAIDPDHLGDTDPLSVPFDDPFTDDAFAHDPAMTWPTPDDTAPEWLRQEF